MSDDDLVKVSEAGEGQENECPLCGAARLRERERLRGYFVEALADKGIVWPVEVDILFDKCFAAPYVPDASAT
jgi:hypothetical protein